MIKWNNKNRILHFIYKVEKENSTFFILSVQFSFLKIFVFMAFLCFHFKIFSVLNEKFWKLKNILFLFFISQLQFSFLLLWKKDRKLPSDEFSKEVLFNFEFYTLAAQIENSLSRPEKHSKFMVDIWWTWKFCALYGLNMLFNSQIIYNLVCTWKLATK